MTIVAQLILAIVLVNGLGVWFNRLGGSRRRS